MSGDISNRDNINHHRLPADMAEVVADMVEVVADMAEVVEVMAEVVEVMVAGMEDMEGRSQRSVKTLLLCFLQ
jgi:hypothetical protein